MNKIALVCDSSADISKEEAAELGIHVIRMPVIIDGVEYVDQETISTQELVHHLALNHKVTTTQPSPGQFLACFDELLETYDQVLYYPLSKNLSGTCASAMHLASEYNGKVVVIDSTFVCQPLVVMLKWAKELLEQGKSAEEIKTLFETQGELYALLIPKTLSALRAGGRISAAAAALGGLLKIQPILTVENGAIDVFDKVRTLKKAYHVAAKHMQEVEDPSQYVWMVIHLNNEETALQLKATMEEQTGQPVLLKEFMAVISAHTGDGTIGIGRIKKVDLH